MLRIAVPNKGSLSQAAQTMLTEAGYLQRRDSRELVLADEANDVEFFYLRPGTSPCMSAPGPWTSGSPGGTC
ncbi:ATP phosphoribosyltransferase [Rothia kristinae]|nr:ATP phosphoribosyltransferase [Rothia kristinae]